MKKTAFLSIIIPAYNEQTRIESTINEILRYFRQKAWRFQITVVDDGSSDFTRVFIQKLALKNREIKLIKHHTNQGKGKAVQTGIFSSPKADFWLMVDADNSTPIAQFSRLFKFAGDFDIVIGSRHLHNSQIKIKQSWQRNILSRASNWLVRQIVLPDFKDTQCGFKLFNKNCLKIFRQQQINGFGFDIEILALAKKLGLKIKEVPISWEDKIGSKMTGKKALIALFELFKIRARLGKIKN